MFQTLWISTSHGIRGLDGSLVSDVLFIDIFMKVLVEKKNHIFMTSCYQGLEMDLLKIITQRDIKQFHINLLIQLRNHTSKFDVQITTQRLLQLHWCKYR